MTTPTKRDEMPESYFSIYGTLARYKMPEESINGISKWERVTHVDVLHLFGTVMHCGVDGVVIRWDDGRIGEMIWSHDVHYDAYRLQTVMTYNTAAPADGELREALKRNQWALTMAALCVLKGETGITDTVWLSDGVTLYDHLVCEIDGADKFITGDVDADIEALEKHAAAIGKAGGECLK